MNANTPRSQAGRILRLPCENVLFSSDGAGHPESIARRTELAHRPSRFAATSRQTIDLMVSRWVMLVVMKAQATDEQIRAVCQKIEELGYRAHSMPGAQRTAIGITGNRTEVEPGTLDEMPGVQELIRVSKPYKLVSRDVKAENTVT